VARTAQADGFNKPAVSALAIIQFTAAEHVTIMKRASASSTLGASRIG
jgi:hypothetical protein